MPSRLILLAAACLLSSADALLVGGGVVPRAHAASNVRMLWGKPQNSAIDRDFERRQEMLNARRQKSASTPKGQVEVTIAGRKTTAKQGEPIAAVARRAGVKIKYDCKVRARALAPRPHARAPHARAASQNGRCATCQVRLNGRSAAKVCQGAKVPGGATRKLTITLDN